MKTLKILAGVILALVLNIQAASACDIRFEIISGKKPVYHKGDTIVVKVEVFLTHRNCEIGIQKTQFMLQGMKVVKATPWQQTGLKTYERTITLVVTDTSKGYASITGVRKCSKTGGFGELKIRCV